MSLSAIMLLVVDMFLMGGMLYILIFRKNKTSRISFLPEPQNKRSVENPPALIAELKEELESVRRIAAGLEKKRLDFEAYERALLEKNGRLESLVKKAEESASNMDMPLNQPDEDIYSKAMKMLKMGIPANEVIRSLGVLSGEVELISALSNFRA